MAWVSTSEQEGMRSPPEGFSEGPPRIFLPVSRIGPLGGYGGPAGYVEVEEMPRVDEEIHVEWEGKRE